MKTNSRKVLTFSLNLLLVFCGPSFSENYKIPQNADVKFRYFVAGIPFGGEFKVTESKFEIAFEQPSESMFSVKFDLTKSNAGFPLATRAMKKVLDASRFPNVEFVSKSVKLKEKFFRVVGSLKVRDVTNQVILIVTVLDNYSSTSEEIRFAIEAKFNRLQFGADDYYPLVSELIIIEDILTLNKIN